MALTKKISNITSFYYIKAIISGLLFTLSFSPFEFVFCAWIAFYLLLRDIKNESTKKAMLYTFLFSISHFASLFYWIGISFYIFSPNLWYLGIISVILITFFMSAYTAIAITISKIISAKKSKLVFGITSIVAFCIAEHLRAHYPFDFSWCRAGHLLVLNQFSASAIHLTNDFTASLIALSPALIVYCANKRFTALFLIITGFLCIFCKQDLHTNHLSQDIKIKAVQPNLTAHHFGSRELQRKALETLASMTAIDKDEYQLIIWPESSYPFVFNKSDEEIKFLSKLAPKNGLLVFGADRMEDGKIYNSIIAINNKEEIVLIYDKKHLVPFGEYVPWREYLFFLDKIVYGIGDFTAGNIDVHIAQDMAFFPMICYEVAFNHQINNNFNFILNITNDAWFGNSSGPYQHLMMARFRAAKHQLPMIRVSNTGISAHISNRGTIIDRIELGMHGTKNFSIR